MDKLEKYFSDKILRNSLKSSANFKEYMIEQGTKKNIYQGECILSGRHEV